MGDNVLPIQIVIGDEDSEDAAVEKAYNYLERFKIDVVIVAPVNAGLFKSMEIPPSWIEWGFNASIDQLVLITKPVDALSSIRNSSWMINIKGWQLDGTT